MCEGRLMIDGDEESRFRLFVSEVEPDLRRALIATYGPERGREATAEALGWAWEHRHELDQLDKPVSYLFRVGQSRSRFRRNRPVFERSASHEVWVEPKLASALSALSEQQRASPSCWSMGRVGRIRRRPSSSASVCRPCRRTSSAP